MLRIASAALVLLGTGLLASPAQAREGTITSFDQTTIAYHFYPARGLVAGAKAPTVMFGPGYSSGGAGEDDALVARYLDHGYNVLTWDPRGFGASTGNVETDSPSFEGRDAQLLVDAIARQPEAQLDRPGDPRLGMIGASYGGGIQNVLASMDSRVDAIAPQIAWHSLLTSLYKNETPKGGWGAVLYGVGTFGSTGRGLAQFQFGRQQDPQTTHAVTTGLTTGRFDDSDVNYFRARGPGDKLIAKIKVPTLLSQGTDDTLFTLAEAIKNYEAGRRAGVPISMNWFCGGLTDESTAHGVCSTPKGPQPGIANDEAFNWMERWVKQDASVDTGPGFRWVSDTGVLHYAEAWPVPQGPPVVGEGKGTLAIAPGEASGALIAAAPAANAITVPLGAAPGAQLLGEPRLELRYSGAAADPDAVVYAQLIDEKRGLAIGNQVTPVRVTLDGAEHALTLPLEAIAADVTAGSTYSLQLTGGTSLYFAARQAALLNVARAKLTIPTVAPGASSTERSAFANPTLKRARACRARRYRVRFAARNSNYVRARVKVDGKLVKTVRRKHVRSVRVRIRTAGTHTVRIIATKRGGRTRRVTRRLAGCV